MHVGPTGDLLWCRWNYERQFGINIRDLDPIDYFHRHMQSVRDAMLNGSELSGCRWCYQMEQHGKVSGRQRQLLKTGIRTDRFLATVQSSPWRDTFMASADNLTPQDWQIDLGNVCNSACLMCRPEWSSRLSREWQQLGLISQAPNTSWAADPVLLAKFISVLDRCDQLRYLHFLGGEPLLNSAFVPILKYLRSRPDRDQITVGFTTNLTVWSDAVIEQLQQFPQVNLGISVEAFAPINDYVRWPSEHTKIQQVFDQWHQLAQQNQWLVTLRITPTCLTVAHMLSVYDTAWELGLSVMSCNFLDRPEYMRPTVLPHHVRCDIAHNLQHWLDQHELVAPSVDTVPVVNTRHPQLAHQAIRSDLASYVSYLRDSEDESWRLPELVHYLKQMESMHRNSVLDYLPEYETIFKSAGY